MQLLRTSIALAASCYLPVPNAGLNSTSCLFSWGLAIRLQPMLALLIWHEHSYDEFPHSFGMQVGIETNLASLRTGRNQDWKSQDPPTFYLP